MDKKKKAKAKEAVSMWAGGLLALFIMLIEAVENVSTKKPPKDDADGDGDDDGDDDGDGDGDDDGDDDGDGDGDDDGDDDDDEEAEKLKAKAKKALKKYAENNSKKKTIVLLAKFKAKKFGDVKEKHYEKLIKQCKK